jgi:HAD superfamily hydrolase (TIGR01509 family)
VTRPRAVLFDLDGVLVDSYEAWFRVVDEAARRFGAPPVSRERFDSVWGQGLDADVQNLYPGRSKAEVRAAYADAMPRHGASIRVNPEAAEGLARLRRAGLGLACVTNTQSDLAGPVLEGAGLAGAFDVVVGAREGLREKPAPDLLLAALSELRTPAADAVMFGDSRYDEEAAAAAGVLFRRYDLRSGESLLAALAPFSTPLQTRQP